MTNEISAFDNNGLMNEAIAEAYASAPTDKIILYSVEINHKTFTEPSRIVRWPIRGNKPDEFYLRLEDDAPYDPGKKVLFLGVPFNITLPDNAADSVGQFRFSVDGIGDSLDMNLENAALGGGKIEVIVREYLKGHEDDGPFSVWEGLELKSPSFEGSTLKAKGMVLGWAVMAYGTKYTPANYPGLVRGK